MVRQKGEMRSQILDTRTFLHLGCGFRNQRQSTTAFASAEWKEIRVDINGDAQPDIVASVTDMSSIPSDSADAAYLSHIIEHLYAYQVPAALREVMRVLKPDGFAVIRCPDLQGIAALVAEGKLTETLYDTVSEGPISAHDMIYGHSRSLARGETWMAHKSGFTAQTLLTAVTLAGFPAAAAHRRGAPGLELWALATKSPCSAEEIGELLGQHKHAH